MPHDPLSARARILRLLRRHGPLDATQLARRLGMTSVGARLHVNVLREKGLVQAQAEHRGVGRPRLLYSPTPEADQHFPKSYETLVTDLLGCLDRVDGPNGVVALLRERRKGLVKRYRPRVGGPLSRRVESVVGIQRERGFMPESRPSDGGFVVREWNCPIAAAAACTGAFCESERRFFQALLGTDVRLEGTRASGSECCTFRVGAPETKEAPRAKAKPR